MGRKAKSPYIQLNLGDRFLNLSERGQKAIMESRLGHFGDKIFPLIDADSFMVLYSENGRGPYYLQGLVGAYLIMRMLHITPDELLLRIDSDIAIQYALHTTSMKTQPFSRRNLFYFMARLDAYESEKGINLIEKCFKDVSASLAREMGLDRPGSSGRIKKRMDSMMVGSHAARLSRPGILYAVNQDALRLYDQLVGRDGIDYSLHHYFEKDDKNAIIYHNKDVMQEKLSVLLAEALQIRELMKEEEWHEFAEYKNLVRCIEDQSVNDGDGNTVPKDSRDVAGTSLQSPRDPDATARTKDHRTYVGASANVAETYDDNGNSLITDAGIESNSHSDSDFMKGYIETKDENAPEEQVTTDGAFYSEENARKAEEKGILLTPTALTGTKTNDLCADFELSEDGTEVASCPNHAIPVSQKYNEKTGKVDAKFSHSDCDSCPFRSQCPGKDQKRAVKVSISRNMVDRAATQRSIGEEAHKQFARERNAVEAIPSIFRRKYGIDRIGTFVRNRLRSAFFSICLAYNVQKHQRFCNMLRAKCALF